MTRRLLLALIVLSIALIGIWAPESSAAYVTCSTAYCSTHPRALCTCPEIEVIRFCNSWEENCPIT